MACDLEYLVKEVEVVVPAKEGAAANPVEEAEKGAEVKPASLKRKLSKLRKLHLPSSSCLK